MILKFKIENCENGGQSWSWLENVTQVMVKKFDYNKALKDFKEKGIPESEVITLQPEDVDKAFMDEVAATPIENNDRNGVYMYISTIEPDDISFASENVHSINIIDDNCSWHSLNRVLCKVNNNEFEIFELITTNECYLLNNDGQTIEKLS